MTIRNKRVYSIKKENSAIERSIIEHTPYARNGYSITHFSMDAHTISSPERFSTPVLVIATSGRVRLIIIDGERKIEKVLEEGQCYLRLSNSFAYYKTEQDKAIATEVKVRNTSVITEMLKEDQIFDLEKLAGYEPSHSVSHYLIKDEKFCVKVKAYSEYTEDAGVSDVSFVVTLLEGYASFMMDNKEYCLNAHQSLYINKGDAFSVKLNPKTKAVLFYMAD